MSSIQTSVSDEAYLRYKQNIAKTEIMIATIRSSKKRTEQMYRQNNSSYHSFRVKQFSKKR